MSAYRDKLHLDKSERATDVGLDPFSAMFGNDQKM
jgi:hypothetical protein